MSTRIVVPLDGSELAECALPWATYLAELKQCDLELLRCFESPRELFLVTDFLVSESDLGPSEVLREKLEAYLAERSAEITSVRSSITCLEGDAATRILEKAQEESVDLVVMASHGRSGLGRWLMGSTSTKVSRGLGSTPILLVKSEEKRREPKLERILVPLDGSQTAEAAIPIAVELAGLAGATVHLYRNVSFAPLAHPQLDSAAQIEAAEAESYLERLKSLHHGANITTESRISGLDSGIVAQGEQCDLIVMSSHGRSGVKRWLLGSVAENVLQTTTRPVLLIHPG